MLNAVESAIGRKLLTALIFAPLLITSLLYSQSNTFKLGFTGAYPNYYGPVVNNPNYKVNWDWYDEFKMNTWQGWDCLFRIDLIVI